MQPAADGPERAKRDPRDFALWKGAKPDEPAEAQLAVAVGPGPARLAHRVLGDVPGATWAPSSTSTAAGST